ncbi:hypothetical protein KIMH_00770 [Bombiscardovia apis]|uniref:Uncharacterized protein n=1 Tax=Bombiscardovia apis TaxID=2932182 RepID=A0ABM8BAV8_9BIFI|nr:hypothetical protein [Bombiscardovia apis]BDR53966.1 hypothetical protein KIMH_00770 [Bombiscardovia apis]
MHEHSQQLWQKSRAKVVGLLSLVLATIMVLAVLPAAHADTITYTYDTVDQFIAGTSATQNGKLTVTKLLTKQGGVKATGADKDKNSAPSGEPGVGVPFQLTRVEPKPGVTAGGMKPNEEATTFNRVSPVYRGTTDATGTIKNGTGTGIGFWQNVTAGGAAVPNFPKDNGAGVAYYYLLEELTTGNPYLGHDNSETDINYSIAEKSIFDIPYRATNTKTTKDGAGNVVGTPTTEDGFVYNLHVYPKNVLESKLSKKVVKVTNFDGSVTRPGKVAQIGDKITWEITQKLYDGNLGSSLNGDGKLDLGEIRGAAANVDVLKIADRQPMAQDGQTGVKVKLNWTDNGQPASQDLDDRASNPAGSYTVDTLEGNLGRNTYGSATGDLLPASGDTADTNHDFTSWGKVYTFRNYSIAESIGTLAGRYQPGHTYTDIFLTITYNTQLLDQSTTGVKSAHVNSGEADPAGYLTNTVASDNIDNYSKAPVRFNVALPTPGFQFAKSNKVDGNTTLAGVSGAVFRITKTGTKNQFLCDDGQYHVDSDIKPSGTGGVHALEARSNKDGVVTFIGLPIIDSSTNAVYANTAQNIDKLQFGILEYTRPVYDNPNYDPGQPVDPVNNPEKLTYEGPSDSFETISFISYAGKTRSELEAAGQGIAGDVSGLNFKDYKTPNIPTNGTNPFKNAKGEEIRLALVNWRKDQKDPAIVGALPLTGGRGIMWMLVAGVSIMFAGLVYTYRSNSRNEYSRPAHAAK